MAIKSFLNILGQLTYKMCQYVIVMELQYSWLLVNLILLQST